MASAGARPRSAGDEVMIREMPTTKETAVPSTLGGAVLVVPLAVPRPLVPADAQEQTIVDVLATSISASGAALADGDILAVSSKVVALFEGGTIRLDRVAPSRRTRFLARLFSKDPHKLELMLREGPILGVVPLRHLSAHRIARRIAGEYSTDLETTQAGYCLIERFEMYMQKYGALLNESGIDIMNSPNGYVTLLPKNPSRSAQRIREEIECRTGRRIAVIVTDTTSPIGRIGTLDVAIGYSGLDPVERKLFTHDLFGDLRPGDANLIIDSAAAIAGAVMGQTTEMRPAALIRGLRYAPERPSPGAPGFEELIYPRRLVARAVLLTLVATVLFRILHFLMFPRSTRTSRPTAG